MRSQNGPERCFQLFSDFCHMAFINDEGGRQKNMVTIGETVDVAIACHAAGADGIHAHVRDAHQEHILDAGLYKELLVELHASVPTMQVQITTESVGKYTPTEQRKLVKDVRPAAVSVALREMTANLNSEQAEVRAFYHEQLEAQTAVQHILYDAGEIAVLCDHFENGVIPNTKLQLLFVLGRHAKNQQSAPADLQPFIHALTTHNLAADWAVCAFGHQETQCLLAGHNSGSKLRVGFENSFWNAAGEIAADNTARVSEISAEIAGVS